MRLLARKPIASIDDSVHGLRRTLGAGDLIMLAIGAVIGAGIFSTLGTAAAGGTVGGIARLGAGPALIISFALLGVTCGLAALCYAELSAMIPQAGSAYAYTYATLGEVIAWIVGWALILEYAVGNVAVAISWSGYFTSLLTAFGMDLPGWLTHGYWNVKASTNPEIASLMQTAPRIGGVPILVNLPAFAIVMAITVVLMQGVRESARANAVMVVIKLLVLALFVGVGLFHIDTANYKPFAPNGMPGILSGGAVVFFAYIGFDAISTAGEETKNPQRNMPIGILGGLAICTVIYIIVGAVATGLVPYDQLQGSDPLARALSLAGLETASWLVSLGAVVSMTAVLLVFQYGQPRIFYAMARDGLLPKFAAKVHPRTRIPHITTALTGIAVAVASLVADDVATFDLTSIGTLAAFVLVCIGVLVIRLREPDRPRPFRVPFLPVVSVLGASACLLFIYWLPRAAKISFAIWMAIGLAVYFAYGYRHSVLRHPTATLPRAGDPES